MAGDPLRQADAPAGGGAPAEPAPLQPRPPVPDLPTRIEPEGDAIVGHIANFGFMRLNWDGPSAQDKTLIVTGADPADGAAIICNAIRQLGIPVFFLPAGAGIKGAGASMSGFGEQARKLTEQYGTWGARVPFRRNMLSAARRIGANPHFIIVMEDATSLALGIEDSSAGGAPEALITAAERIIELSLFTADLTWPSMVLSIQKAREFASSHIDALSLFTGATPSPEARLAAISIIDQGARTLNPTPLGFRSTQGALDKVQRRTDVRGWAKQPLSNARVRVRALVNGVDAGEALADEQRPDLVKHKIGDGNHGFTIPLKHLLTNDVQTVQVIAVEDNSLIGTAAMTVKGGHAIG